MPTNCNGRLEVEDLSYSKVIPLNTGNLWLQMSNLSSNCPKSYIICQTIHTWLVTNSASSVFWHIIFFLFFYFFFWHIILTMNFNGITVKTLSINFYGSNKDIDGICISSWFFKKWYTTTVYMASHITQADGIFQTLVDLSWRSSISAVL